MTRACARLLVMGHQSSSRPAAEKPLPSPQNTLPSPHRCSLSNRFKKHLPSELPDRQHVVSIFRVMSRMPSELPEQGSGSGCQGPRHSAESIWRRGLVALRAATHGGANRTPVSVPGAGTRLRWQGPAPPRLSVGGRRCAPSEANSPLASAPTPPSTAQRPVGGWPAVASRGVGPSHQQRVLFTLISGRNILPFRP